MNPAASLAVMFLGYRLFGGAGMLLMPIAAHTALTLYRNGSFK
jgi:predicted PurR-regulated permease PerM